MERGIGLRMAAGVLGAISAGVTLVISLLMILFGGILSAVSSSGGGSVAGSGFLLFMFGSAALAVSATFFLLPWARGAAFTLAVLTAAILWAFGRVDAIGLSMLVVVPLCFAVLCGLAAGSKPTAANG